MVDVQKLSDEMVHMMETSKKIELKSRSYPWWTGGAIIEEFMATRASKKYAKNGMRWMRRAVFIAWQDGRLISRSNRGELEFTTEKLIEGREG